MYPDQSTRVRKGMEQVMDFALIAISVHSHVEKFVDTCFPAHCNITDTSQRIWWATHKLIHLEETSQGNMEEDVLCLGLLTVNNSMSCFIKQYILVASSAILLLV